MFSRKVQILAAGLLLSIGAMAQQDSARFQGRDYIKENNQWFQVGANGRFAVEPSVITIKMKEQAATRADEVATAIGGQIISVARTGFIDIRIPAGADPIAITTDYASHPLVEIAEPNTIGVWGITPDDPSLGSQWHFTNISGEAGWDKQTGSDQIIISVLDSGTDFRHEDLGMGSDGYQNVWLNDGEDAWSDPNNPNTGNGIDDDGNGFIDDWKGWDFGNGNNDPAGTFNHGTMVAGIVGAKTNNGTDVAGVVGGWGGPGCKVMIGGVGDSAPLGSILDDAILYSADKGAHVIQMSLTVGLSSAIESALQTAYEDSGIFIVCAAGNSGAPSLGFPASNEFVFSVAATNPSDLKAGFSQYGNQLDIAAPGTSITTLTLNNGVTSGDGTSFAAPIISAVAGAMLSTAPELTNDDIRQIMYDTADKVGGYDYNWDPTRPGHSRELGYGRINLEKALCALGIDLFVKDNENDLGQEPNVISGDEVFDSPDVWNCVDNPDCTQHMDPVFGADNHVRVRVHNRFAATEQNANLRLFWSRGRSASLYPDHWLHPDAFPQGNNLINGNPGGAEITVVDNVNFVPDPVIIPPTPGGTSTIFTRSWQPPDPALFPVDMPGEKPVIALTARIESTEDPVTNDTPGSTQEIVSSNNNMAMRQTVYSSIEPDNPESDVLSFNVHNIEGASAAIDILVVDEVTQNYPGKLTLVLSQDLENAWIAGGSVSEGMNGFEVVDSSAGGWLRNIQLSADQTASLGIMAHLEPGVEPPADDTYRFSVGQYLNGSPNQQGAVIIDTLVMRSFMGLFPDWPSITILDILHRL